VIDEVGVTKTTFYNHFESKDALILAVLDARDRREMEDWLRTMRERGGEDPRAQLLALFDILDEWFSTEAYCRCLFLNAAAQFPAPSDPIHIAAGKHGAHLYAELRRLAAAAGAKDPESLAGQLVLVVAGALVTRQASPVPGNAATAREVARMLIREHLPEST
jgi:AcrR family transcriptional regulator